MLPQNSMLDRDILHTSMTTDAGVVAAYVVPRLSDSVGTSELAGERGGCERAHRARACIDHLCHAPASGTGEWERGGEPGCASWLEVRRARVVLRSLAAAGRSGRHRPSGGPSSRTRRIAGGHAGGRQPPGGELDGPGPQHWCGSRGATDGLGRRQSGHPGDRGCRRRTDRQGHAHRAPRGRLGRGDLDGHRWRACARATPAGRRRHAATRRRATESTPPTSTDCRSEVRPWWSRRQSSPTAPRGS